jgi:hypothetical protein
LLSFRNSITNHPYIESLAQWTGSDVCSWPGVTCWSEGVNIGLVRSIQLPHQTPKLLGEVSADIPLIQSLEYLDLSSNDLCGYVPDFTATGTCHQGSIKSVELSNNRFLRSHVVISPLLLANIKGLNLFDEPNLINCPPDLSGELIQNFLPTNHALNRHRNPLLKNSTALPCAIGEHFDWTTLNCTGKITGHSRIPSMNSLLLATRL